MGERKPLKQPARDFLFQETGFPHLRARIVTGNAVTGGSRSGPSSSFLVGADVDPEPVEDLPELGPYNHGWGRGLGGSLVYLVYKGAIRGRQNGNPG